MSDQGDGNLPPPPPPSSGPPPSGPGSYGVTQGGLPGGRTLADPWPRIGARILDALIVGIPLWILAFAVIGVDGSVAPGASIGYSLLSLVAGAAYEIGFVGAKGATPGKMIVNVRVVRQEDGVTPPGFDRAALRWLPALLGVIPFLGGLAQFVIVVLSLVWLFSDDHRRTVYDRIATTYVVQSQPGD